MQEQKPVSQLAKMKRQSFFFVTRMMVISFLIIVGSLMLLPQARADAQAAQQNASGIVMNTAIYDVTHNRYYGYNAPNSFVTGSSMKVPIMLTFLDMIEREGRSATSHELYLLRTMIENSNNDSASALYYGEIGGAAGVSSYMQRIGITGLYPDPNAWGWSVISPWTMVALLTRLYEGTILNTYDRNFALYLMENVEWDQRWGVGDTAPSGALVAMKNGWVPAPDGLWDVNSSGIVMTNNEVYIIASYTREDPSFGAGVAEVNWVCGDAASWLV